MTIRRVVLALLVALLALGALAPPRAYAGGPTSLLLVNPTDGRTAAAYHRDPAYEEVAIAVGDGSSGPLDPPASVGPDRMPTVRLTWLIHDVSVWRLDRIHVTAGDGIWVETTMGTDGSGRLPDGGGRWHRPAGAERLTTALTQAGLLGDGPRSETATTTPAATPGWWPLVAAGLGGLACGVAGAVAGRGLVRRNERAQA